MMKTNERSAKMTEEKVPQTPEEINDYMVENERLILAVLRRYKGLSDYEDLFQEASIGFYKGIISFKPNMGVRLSTYAYTCAQNEVKMYLRQANSKGRGSGSKTISLETGDGSEDYRPDRLVGMIMTYNDTDPVDKVYADSVFRAALAIVNSMLDHDSRIVIYRFMQKVPQSKVAEELNVSQGHVSKMQARALSLIREQLSLQGLIDVA